MSSNLLEVIGSAIFAAVVPFGAATEMPVDTDDRSASSFAFVADSAERIAPTATLPADIDTRDEVIDFAWAYIEAEIQHKYLVTSVEPTISKENVVRGVAELATNNRDFTDQRPLVSVTQVRNGHEVEITYGLTTMGSDRTVMLAAPRAGVSAKSARAPRSTGSFMMGEPLSDVIPFETVLRVLNLK